MKWIYFIFLKLHLGSVVLDGTYGTRGQPIIILGGGGKEKSLLANIYFYFSIYWSLNSRGLVPIWMLQLTCLMYYIKKHIFYGEFLLLWPQTKHIVISILELKVDINSTNLWAILTPRPEPPQIQAHQPCRQIHSNNCQSSVKGIECGSPVVVLQSATLFF